MAVWIGTIGSCWYPHFGLREESPCYMWDGTPPNGWPE